MFCLMLWGLRVNEKKTTSLVPMAVTRAALASDYNDKESWILLRALRRTKAQNMASIMGHLDENYKRRKICESRLRLFRWPIQV